eukprot:TRINITY_DN23590_c0_g1_i1.p2 TRINITY_DN23590_c0_g1~~TRINITY_DN23590_c0_g1_i1.p2  ORF type:complete len:246 (-),score=31.72 TRINITY_DN23590_c0_g1_i1:1574-2311(-)
METIFGNRRMPSIDPNAFFGDIDSKARTHIAKVYSTLTGATAAVAIGALFTIYYHVNQTLCWLGALGFMIGLAWTPHIPGDEAQQNKRLLLLAATAFFKGAALGPLIQAALYINPSIVPMAALGAVTIFGCFTAAALTAKRRQYLYIGGFLGSATMLMCFLGLANMFFHSTAVFNVQLYGGLLLFCGYVVFDTQMIIEKAHNQYPDHIHDALELLIDLVAIFVRLLIILMRNQGKQDRRKRNDRR